ncbi:hypothetical protein, variant [Capsaspora owczarzaki ATCC 30864]|uniref:Pycsar effector protein domain-containing protein n=1 Tax=Capsaspora owczarzaki (strain ATCC 30864) TaxID=595528 RepID=A0A0D2UTG4_CAPO3|nr:hypothetical protein, variant [Capsaspora owczarzaki ATCC 30864]
MAEDWKADSKASDSLLALTPGTASETGVERRTRPRATKLHIDFLKTAIEDTQETIRFLDTKAGMIVAFESVLLSGALFEAGGMEVLQALLNRGYSGFIGAMLFGLLLFSAMIVYHVQLTLRAIFPAENPSKHVDNGGLEPPNTFLLWRMDKNGMMQPSLPTYLAQVTAMDEDDVATELSSQLLKLSYIRKRKQDILSKSFLWLFGLVIAFIAVQLLHLVASLYDQDG